MVVCPAFQSTYILDDSARNAYFSYAWQLDEYTRNEYFASKQGSSTTSLDSFAIDVQQPKTDYYAYVEDEVVPWRVPKRTKYGIQKSVPYPIKNYRLKTAPMENVLTPEKQTNNFVASDFNFDSLSFAAMDSLAFDSTQLVAATEENEGPGFLHGYDPGDNFNVEQEYYNKYFGKKLVDTRPKPKPSLIDSTQTVMENDTASIQPKKGLFKRRRGQQLEETDPVEEETNEELDPNNGN